ncbi:hypothetical protein [Pseudomarimonas arenosa]|uniref:DUF4124 domain-containing protein n=1 Tax=Pseudomarimonas arenosa TaxID=2774145 RepID=A0AAW3ZSZ2_9GAMM|nr:hypothetical protein [Pseudomarimonas arenosa]MBD8528137.1 hypothetical protein [Pseudomarimonas arenosa]
MYRSAKYSVLLMSLLAGTASAVERMPVDLSGWEITIDGVPVCSDPSLNFSSRKVECRSEAVKQAESAKTEDAFSQQLKEEELRAEQEARLVQVQRQCRSDASYASVLSTNLRYDATRNVCVEKGSGREQPCPDCPVIVRSPKPPVEP